MRDMPKMQAKSYPKRAAGGRARAAAQTPEQRRAQARNAGRAAQAQVRALRRLVAQLQRAIAQSPKVDDTP